MAEEQDLGVGPALVPPKLAVLIDRLIASGGARSALRHVPAPQKEYRLPGRPESRPRNPLTVVSNMADHGLSVIHARNTAMMEAVSEMPAIVVSDLFGMSVGSAYNWAQYAQTGWPTTWPHPSTSPSRPIDRIVRRALERR